MESEKNKSGLSKEAQEMQDRLCRNFDDLHWRMQEYSRTPGMIRQEGALEDLLFCYQNSDVGDLLPLFMSGKKSQVPAAAGVPSREGADAAFLTALPPIDNMGLHKYQTSPPPTEQERNAALQNAVLNHDQHRHRTLGGYDGGVEVGFNGDWNPQAFTEILEQLKHAQEMSQGN